MDIMRFQLLKLECNVRQHQQQMLCWRSSGTIKPGVFELSDIVDHVVKFSAYQCGSRFIQQKIETATEEEKRKDFTEIIPHAHTLATDVFGNYVIQKALEVVDVEEKIWMVAEFDGLVMKCVHDQNDNHVIQKCIECIPEDRIHFKISAFCGQVFALSTHPYGCRVIQGVLESCHYSNIQRTIMAEIMESVCTLAQDQNGNYAIQASTSPFMTNFLQYDLAIFLIFIGRN